MKVASLISIGVLGCQVLAEDFPSPQLQSAMADALKGCRDSQHFVISRKKAFFPELTLVRAIPDSDSGFFEPYVCDRNKRFQFAVAIGTRPHTSDGKRGTLLYFVVGSENPKGYGTGGAGLFVPKKGAKALVHWRDAADGTLALVTFNGALYHLRLRTLQAIPK